jgi:hypothetical protein
MSASEFNLVIHEVTRRMRHDYGRPVVYPRIWRAICEGAVEAEKVNGRWMIREADVPVLAEALGLTRMGKGEQ